VRYFIECAYNGSRYSGWQRQPGEVSVQQTLEEAFSLILREPIEITGCGRTDAGVHAAQYFFHFDTSQPFLPEWMDRFNKYLPDDIALYTVYSAADSASARFDAVQRTYKYYLRFIKDPLTPATSLWYPYQEKLDFIAMQKVAALLEKYEAFKPFCKEGSDAKHYRCNIFKSHWDISDTEAIFTITANRFLRGMVRLIVGTCLQAGRGKLTIAEVTAVLDQQTPMPRADSVPPQGLHLVEVKYPDGLLTRL
jgi:tRNA pseudouridine38-40 synthase